MLVLVQFPFADLRHFADASEVPLLGADWSLAPEQKNPDFVRGFGPLRKRSKTDAASIRAWQGEAWFARASRAIRFPQLTDRDFARAGVKLVPQLALRRVFCNGAALWRVELAIAFDPRTRPDFAQVLAAISDFISLKVRVRDGSRWGAAAPLSTQGEAIGRALAHSTTYRDTAAARRALDLRAGRPMVLVELRTGDGNGPWAPGTADADRTCHVVWSDPTSDGKIEVDFLTIAIDRVDCPLVVLRSSGNVRTEISRDVRTHLSRLHAEREVLTQVFRATRKGRIAEANGELERYFTQAQSELFTDSRFGVEQSVLKQMFDIYDRIAPAETDALVALLKGRRQSIGRVETLSATYRDGDGRPVIHMEGGMIIMNDNRVSVAGNNSGVINVAGTFTNTGNIIQGASNDEVKSALESLKALTVQLADKLPEPAKQQGVANKLEALTKEATAAEPDHDMLKVTGKGLIDAAKTVAGMAAPIAKAVGVVLGIFGLVL